MLKLTVVIISRNQEWNIARLIESVLKHTACAESREIILIDSASTDQTTEIASNYPINVLKLSADQHLGPSAGRYVGFQHTTGEYILFLDGDNELYPGWFEKGLNTLKTHPDFAVITGVRVVLPVSATEKHKPPTIDIPMENLEIRTHCGGTALYKRAVLDEVGTFNPYLYSDEEPDLAIRIRHAGYKIVRLDHPIAYDYTDPIDQIQTKIARWKRNLYLGAGQNLRNHLGTETFWMYLKERGYGLVPLLGLIVGIVALVWSLMSGQATWFSLWAVVVVLALLADAVRKRSLSASTASLIQRLLIMDGTVRGFLLKPRDPTSYPARHVMIKDLG
ncbi:MAG: glycosyltransferase family A protein [Chloroflexota bacterium]